MQKKKETEKDTKIQRERETKQRFTQKQTKTDGEKDYTKTMLRQEKVRKRVKISFVTKEYVWGMRRKERKIESESKKVKQTVCIQSKLV